jgi:hypothetical protein
MQEEISSESKETKAKKEKDEAQITVSLECEAKLQMCLARVNEGFEFTKVPRKQLAIYLIDRGLDEFGEQEIQEVRQMSLTDMALFERAYRQAKESGVIPEEMRQILWKSLSLIQSPKRSKKSGQTKYSKAIHEDVEAA